MPEKYEREIEEIVAKKGKDLGPRTPLRQVFKDFQGRLRSQFALQLAGIFRWVTPTRVGALGAILLVAGLFAKRPYLVLLGLALLLGAYLLSIARGSRTFQETTGHEKSWRGRSLAHREPSRWRLRLRRWLGKKR